MYFDDPDFRKTFIGQSKFIALVQAYFDAFNGNSELNSSELKRLYDDRNTALIEIFSKNYCKNSKAIKRNGDKNNEWYTYDDIQLTEIKTNEDDEILPYMVFYMKNGIDGSKIDTNFLETLNRNRNFSLQENRLENKRFNLECYSSN